MKIPPVWAKHKRVVENMLSLFILQGTSYVLSFLTLPYLIRVLGAERFGLYAFGLALTQYLMAFTDYGFNQTAARRISLARHNIREVSRIYSNVLVMKLGLMGISFLFLLGLVWFIPYFARERLFYLLFFAGVPGSVLFPVWLYQGLEKMKYISYLTLAAKLTVTCSVFLLVKEPDDYRLAAFLQAMIYLISGLISLMVNRRLGVSFVPALGWREIRRELADGGQLFLSSISFYVYNLGAQFVTGLRAGYASAGYLASVQKLSAAIAAGTAQPAAQALYPGLCRLYRDDRSRFYGSAKRMIWAGGGLSILFSLALLVCSGPLIRLVTGSSAPELHRLMQIFSLITGVNMSNALLNSLLLAMNGQRQLQSIYTSAALLFLAGCLPVLRLAGSPGIAGLLAAVELLIWGRSLRWLLNRSRLNGG